jgi:hypothetical protein
VGGPGLAFETWVFRLKRLAENLKILEGYGL